MSVQLIKSYHLDNNFKSLLRPTQEELANLFIVYSSDGWLFPRLASKYPDNLHTRPIHKGQLLRYIAVDKTPPSEQDMFFPTEQYILLLDTVTSKLVIFKRPGEVGTMFAIEDGVYDYSGRFISPPANHYTTIENNTVVCSYGINADSDVVYTDRSVKPKMQAVLSFKEHDLEFSKVATDGDFSGFNVGWYTLNGTLCILVDGVHWYQSAGNPCSIQDAIALGLNPVVGLSHVYTTHGMIFSYVTHKPDFAVRNTFMQNIKYANVILSPTDTQRGFVDSDFDDVEID